MLGYVGDESFRDGDTHCLVAFRLFIHGKNISSAKSIVAMIGITIGAIWYVSGDILSGEGAYLYWAQSLFSYASKGGLQRIDIK